MIKLLEWKGITQSRNKNVQKPVANILLNCNISIFYLRFLVCQQRLLLPLPFEITGGPS